MYRYICISLCVCIYTYTHALELQRVFQGKIRSRNIYKPVYYRHVTPSCPGFCVVQGEDAALTAWPRAVPAGLGWSLEIWVPEREACECFPLVEAQGEVDLLFPVGAVCDGSFCSGKSTGCGVRWTL